MTCLISGLSFNAILFCPEMRYASPTCRFRFDSCSPCAGTTRITPTIPVAPASAFWQPRSQCSTMSQVVLVIPFPPPPVAPPACCPQPYCARPCRHLPRTATAFFVGPPHHPSTHLLRIHMLIYHPGPLARRGGHWPVANKSLIQPAWLAQLA